MKVFCQLSLGADDLKGLKLIKLDLALE